MQSRAFAWECTLQSGAQIDLRTLEPPHYKNMRFEFTKRARKTPWGFLARGTRMSPVQRTISKIRRRKHRAERNDSQQCNHKVSLALPTSSLGEVSGPLLSHRDGETVAEALLNRIQHRLTLTALKVRFNGLGANLNLAHRCRP